MADSASSRRGFSMKRKEYGYMKRIYAGLLLISVMMLGLCGACCFAEEPDPTPMPVPAGTTVVYATYSQDNEIYLLKEKLYNLNYYVNFVTESNLSSKMLDDLTMAAILKVCKTNGLEYVEYGILPETWDAIMSESIISLVPTPEPESVSVTPAPTPRYQHIYWDEHSDAVTRIQSRLAELGYGHHFNPGHYDSALLAAIDEFCRFNEIQYDQHANNGITAELQSMMLDAEVATLIPFSTPTVEPELTPEPTAAPGKLESIRNYFQSSTQLMGIRVPNLILWLVCLLLIVSVVILIIHFFLPSDENARQSGARAHTTRTSGTGKHAKGRVTFIVSYRGSTPQQCSYDIEHLLRIGRGVGDFPLHPEDTRVSRKHCELYYLNNKLMLRDYSSNGTLVNGNRCHHGEFMLTSGDRIQIGDHRIEVRF